MGPKKVSKTVTPTAIITSNTVIGRFEFGDKLGSGACAEVYRVRRNPLKPRLPPFLLMRLPLPSSLPPTLRLTNLVLAGDRHEKEPLLVRRVPDMWEGRTCDPDAFGWQQEKKADGQGASFGDNNLREHAVQQVSVWE